MNTISPDIACETCKVVARSPEFSGAMDAKCTDCCVRHILRTVDVLGDVGKLGAERIKDALFEELSKGREGERPSSV